MAQTVLSASLGRETRTIGGIMTVELGTRGSDKVMAVTVAAAMERE